MAVTFLVLLAAAGVRATPGVMIQPLEHSFGWSTAQISSAISVNLVLYGLLGPFAAALMKTIGVRQVAVIALVLLALGTLSSLWMRTPLELILSWGLLVGTGSGMAALTLGATVANRWFNRHRGLAMGLMTASSATGQLVFLPLMAALVTAHGWQAAAWTSGLGAVVVLPIAWFAMRESPATMGLAPVGGHAPDEGGAAAVAEGNPFALALRGLTSASKHGAFWLLAASFFICGASTNGFIGTHFVSMCSDHGITAVHSASLLATMGIFDLFGTTLSGWLSDRYDNRKLLFWYYGLRGLSLLYLPYAYGLPYYGLPVFTIFYGLDWIATVPPTVRLTNSVFGRDQGPIVFGWIVACHQLGAAFATLMAGVLRASLGNYQLATMGSGLLCIAGALVVLRIRAGRSSAMVGAAA
ncbi:MFS transporter [Frateuria aurantia]